MDSIAQAQEKARKLVVGGSVSPAEKQEIEATQEAAGYKHMSHFVREVLLAVSRSEPARTAVLAVVGRHERRAA